MYQKWAFSILLSVALPSLVWPQTNLDQETFKKLHAEIQSTNESWSSIAWHFDLVAAQSIAAKQKKPLFIWAMDGHPLGCT